MKKQIEKLSQEDLEKKANELSLKYGCKVEPIEFIREENDEQIVGYIKTPNRMLKARVMDMAVQGTMSAAGTLLDAVLLKEESDKRLSSDKSEDDDVYFGAALAAFATIEIAVNQFKKK